MTEPRNQPGFATRSIHGPLEADSSYGATSVPLYQSAAFAYDTAEELRDVFQGRCFGYLYSRIANPTVSALEQRLNSLEQGRGGIATASGMAAIATTFYTLVRPGDEIVASKSLFGGTLQLLGEIFENYGVGIHYVEAVDVAAYRRALTERSRLIFLETIGNPKLDIPDIRQIAAVAAENNVPLVVDSTLTTPCLFPAKQYGVNIVIHSTSKYISGSGNAIGGLLVDLGNFDWTASRSPAVAKEASKTGDFAFLARARRQVLQNTGSCLTPFNAYLQSVGLETLSLRMERHCQNALQLAEFLQRSPKVESVNYPGLRSAPGRELAENQFQGRFGGVLALRLGSEARCFQLINRLKLVKNLANLGDAKTLIIHPASTIYYNCTESERLSAGVYPDLLRVSAGIEDIQDICDDFEHALTEVE